MSHLWAISVATNSSYTPVSGDQDYYLFFCVTPVAQSGTTPGAEACSAASAQVIPATANKLAFTRHPSGTATAGTEFGTQPVVTVQDADGNTVTESASIQLGLTTAGGAVLTCTANPVTAASGVAASQGCKVDKAGSYTLTATSTGLTDAVLSLIHI